ncbi:MAG: hypothetical protein HY369_03505 [Candidatus Aenigmarchaeota archaeon]|nr:hypothetical protein [Candidatus Aenigmarchaeota archaeon]
MLTFRDLVVACDTDLERQHYRLLTAAEHETIEGMVLDHIYGTADLSLLDGPCEDVPGGNAEEFRRLYQIGALAYLDALDFHEPDDAFAYAERQIDREADPER